MPVNSTCGGGSIAMLATGSVDSSRRIAATTSVGGVRKSTYSSKARRSCTGSPVRRPWTMTWPFMRTELGTITVSQARVSIAV
jgi:hypothetical protein